MINTIKRFRDVKEKYFCISSIYCKRSGATSGQVCKRIWLKHKMIVSRTMFGYSERNLCGIWILMRNQLWRICLSAIRVLLLFLTSRLLEALFQCCWEWNQNSDHISKHLNMVFVVLLLNFPLVWLYLFPNTSLILLITVVLTDRPAIWQC